MACRYKWVSRGDVTAFFALMPDNMATMAVMAALLKVFGIPDAIIFGLMIPGTALGVLVGDLLFTWLAFRLAKRSGSTSVCAIPLGIDTPSSIGVIVCVLGPVFVQLTGSGMTPEAAGMQTWYVGLATMLLIGLFKTAMSFCGGWIQSHVPHWWPVFLAELRKRHPYVITALVIYGLSKIAIPEEDEAWD